MLKYVKAFARNELNLVLVNSNTLVIMLSFFNLKLSVFVAFINETKFIKI